VGRGAKVLAHDPEAHDTARAVFSETVQYVKDPYEAIDDASALVIVTEWLVYRNPDFDRMKKVLRRPLVIDGRNLYDPTRMAALGFEYHGIGTQP
jgi:UDPglucose 6-dehydrogenase